MKWENDLMKNNISRDIEGAVLGENLFLVKGKVAAKAKQPKVLKES